MSHHKDHHKQEQQPKDQAHEKSQPAQPADDLTTQLAAIKAERDDLFARLQRVSADYVNYQKRAVRDLQQAREYANEELIKSLLFVLDDMERALEAARANHVAEDPMIVGMELVHKKAMETLDRFGLTIIDAAGKPFDPEKHSALLQEPSSQHPARTVLRELQKGYQLKGRTIRPAHVVVSTEADAEKSE